MSKHEKYSATPLGVLLTVLDEKSATIAIDALELHMRRFYGPTPGIVIDKGVMFFASLGSEPA